MLDESYVAPCREIMSKGKVVMTVRGLSLVDLSYLLNDHKDEVLEVWALWNDTAANGKTDDLESRILAFASDFILKAPSIMANLIATAADARHAAPLVAKMGIEVQLEAINHIVNLTVEDFGGAKKMFEQLLNLVGANLPQMLKEELSKKQSQ